MSAAETKLVAKLDHVDIHGRPCYFVYANDRVVGSIRDLIPKGISSHNDTWFWGPNHPHDLGRPKPCWGQAPTRDAALVAFRKAWDARINPDAT